MQPFYATRRAMQKMPFFLRQLTGVCLIFAPMFLLAAIFPFGDHFIGGLWVSFADFWGMGGGPVFLAISLTTFLFAYGCIRGRRWLRPFAVGLGWTLAALFIYNMTNAPFHIIDAEDERDMGIMIILFGCFPVWYFYFGGPVKEYFGVTRRSSVSHS